MHTHIFFDHICKTIIFSNRLYVVSALQLKSGQFMYLDKLPNRMTWRQNLEVTAVNRLAFMFSLQTPVHTYRRVNNIPSPPHLKAHLSRWQLAVAAESKQQNCRIMQQKREWIAQWKVCVIGGFIMMSRQSGLMACSQLRFPAWTFTAHYRDVPLCMWLPEARVLYFSPQTTPTVSSFTRSCVTERKVFHQQGRPGAPLPKLSLQAPFISDLT